MAVIDSTILFTLAAFIPKFTTFQLSWPSRTCGGPSLTNGPEWISHKSVSAFTRAAKQLVFQLKRGAVTKADCDASMKRQRTKGDRDNEMTGHSIDGQGIGWKDETDHRGWENKDLKQTLGPHQRTCQAWETLWVELHKHTSFSPSLWSLVKFRGKSGFFHVMQAAAAFRGLPLSRGEDIWTMSSYAWPDWVEMVFDRSRCYQLDWNTQWNRQRPTEVEGHRKPVIAFKIYWLIWFCSQ